MWLRRVLDLDMGNLSSNLCTVGLMNKPNKSFLLSGPPFLSVKWGGKTRWFLRYLPALILFDYRDSRESKWTGDQDIRGVGQSLQCQHCSLTIHAPISPAQGQGPRNQLPALSRDPGSDREGKVKRSCWQRVSGQMVQAAAKASPGQHHWNVTISKGPDPSRKRKACRELESPILKLGSNWTFMCAARAHAHTSSCKAYTWRRQNYLGLSETDLGSNLCSTT